MHRKAGSPEGSHELDPSRLSDFLSPEGATKRENAQAGKAEPEDRRRGDVALKEGSIIARLPDQLPIERLRSRVVGVELSGALHEHLIHDATREQRSGVERVAQAERAIVRAPFARQALGAA